MVACSPRLPDAAKDLAISVLCDFPAKSGENRCKSVEISLVKFQSGTEYSVPDDLPVWCIEINYVDYTGEKGIALVRMHGPTRRGEFEILGGPVLDEHCNERN